jgi:hypothetical protein
MFILQCNAHRIVVTDENLPAALGIFPATSMLNHSCVPNCAHYFRICQGERPTVVMLAIEDIEAGAELTYSYTPLYQSTHNRRTQLAKAYGFTCSCARCESGTEAYLESLPAEGRVHREMQTCLKLITDRDPATQRAMVKRLSAMLAGSSLADAHPLCLTLCSSYAALAKAAWDVYHRSDDETSDKDLPAFAVAVAYAVLNTACSLHVTRRLHRENMELLYILALSTADWDAPPREINDFEDLFQNFLTTVGFSHREHEAVSEALSTLSRSIPRRGDKSDSLAKLFLDFVMGELRTHTGVERVRVMMESLARLRENINGSVDSAS